MFGSRGMSRHSDVLDCPVPTEPREIASLVDELKRRGNQAFSKGIMEEAEVLYSRAIEVTQSDVHILHSNRSATRLKMGKKELALEDAEAAVAALPSFAKGYFRQGQALIALKRYSEAVDVLTKADSLEAGNASVLKALAEAKDLQAKHASSTAAADERPVSPKKRTIHNAPSFPSSTSKSGAPPAKSAHVVVEDGEEDLKGVRGYKKLADGRVTTFFNNELTAEDKALIGSIAPQKIDDAQAVQIKNVEGGSAWNQGNSFEEKDLSAFARDRVTQLIQGVPPQPLTLDGTSGLLSIKEVKDMAGDASVAVVRGAKRYIFDLAFTVDVTWTPTDAAVSPLQATVKFLDMSSDSGGDYDVEVVVAERYSHPKGKALHQSLTSKAATSFQRLLFDRLQVFVAEFHAN
ncbi:hypothetical protein DYB30_007595 [Aphanomyces astaci]|uniref:Activator of Hsp90 ATPase AHSA1-like N-terminal domain-containing protein n=1 Tax=Aphanomyces astaci TaxID=112090 RepID=A0A397C6N8_APHAT|nr:hypothetical protein DYB30_007595 [Aphanomyces astaci]